MRIHTASELREIDSHAADVLGVPTSLLMENAGRAVAHHAAEALGAGGRVVVVCGKGNNGGDGYVAARHLVSGGFSAVFRSLGEHPGARAARACGVAATSSLESFGPGDVVVDALFGTGLTRALEGEAAALVSEINAARARGATVVAVDVPSGLDADLPGIPAVSVIADVTVALHALKPCHVQHPARGVCGKVVLESIGLPAVYAPGPVRRWITDLSGRIPARAEDAHKGSSGHVLVVAGSGNKSGAAMLACRAAFRSGAGLVTLASSQEVLDRVMPEMSEIMAFTMPVISGDALLEALDRKASLVIGPGITYSEYTASVLVELLRHVEMPIVIDADGLNALASQPHPLAELERSKSRPILTPHPAELARLLSTTTEAIQADRFQAATSAARRFNAHVVLKGAGTVVAHPDGSLEVISTGSPALATAGTGDVLAGVAGAFLAMKLDDAALLAAHVHGRAGDLASQGLSRGLIASDVIDVLPEAIAELA